MVRLQKLLSEAGVASRRAAEVLIKEGRVRVNNRVVTELGTKVDPDHDLVAVDDQPVRVRRKVYVMMNKPPGFICTRSDPEQRRTVMELLPPEWANVYPVGRLDRESEGLLFLTNDGEFALRLTHPRYGVRKIYLATVEGEVPKLVAGKLVKGVEHEGELLKAEKAKVLSANHSHSVLELELAEGRNREVRRMLEACGFTVVRLVRVQVGKIRLGELRPGKWRTLTGPEIKSLIEKL
jgi:23S rRNA pseudouridine2605 synthase